MDISTSNVLAYSLGYMVIGGGAYGLIRMCMNLRSTMSYAAYTLGFYLLMFISLAILLGLVKLVMVALTLIF